MHSTTWIYSFIGGLIIAIIVGFLITVYNQTPRHQVTFTIENTDTVVTLSRTLATNFSWTLDQQQRFIYASQGTLWDAVNDTLIILLRERYNWQEAEISEFLTHSALYSETLYNPLLSLYIPGTYIVLSDDTPEIIARQLTNKIVNTYPKTEDLLAHLENVIDPEIFTRIKTRIHGFEPPVGDLVVYPVQDIGLEYIDNELYLMFSTTYSNSGEASIELNADEHNDSEHAHVTQKIQWQDNTFLNIPIGDYIWHDTHLHYHLDDFMTYILQYESDPTIRREEAKVSFCLRDVEYFGTTTNPTPKTFSICDTNAQGLSPGWGDTYYYGYDDQYIEIDNLPSGVYTLTFVINPSRSIIESRYENNTVSKRIKIDKKEEFVEILDDI